jgi:hypothetical protein
MGFPYRQAIYLNGASGGQASFNLDPMVTPFNASVAIVLLSGASATYGIQYALDDPITVSDANAHWLNSSQLPAGQTASAAMSFYGPVYRVRVNIASLSGGNLLMQVLQGIG